MQWIYLRDILFFIMVYFLKCEVYGKVTFRTRIWFNGRIKASQALDEGSILFIRSSWRICGFTG